MPLISLVTPCFNEEKAIPLFHAEVLRVLGVMQEKFSTADDPISFEVIYVDDGSSDSTLSTIKKVSAESVSTAGLTTRYVSFSRNFGKEAALLAGLDVALGQYVATMDVDLQDPPSLLPEMYNILRTTDVDNVATRRVTRKGEPPIRSFFARQFYRIINRLSDTEIMDGARDFRLMSRQMANAIVSMRENNRFSKGIFGWVGFKTHWIEYENIERAAGETKWNFFSLFAYSIEGIVAFSTKPLLIASLAGLIFCLVSLALLVFVIVRASMFGDPVAGWPSLVCLLLFIGGTQMLTLGIFGQYLAKTYIESKSRPIYIVSQSSE